MFVFRSWQVQHPLSARVAAVERQDFLCLNKNRTQSFVNAQQRPVSTCGLKPTPEMSLCHLTLSAVPRMCAPFAQRCEALRGKGQCVTDDAAAAGHFRHAKQLLESSSCPLEMELRFKICLDLAGCLYREDQFKECGDACEEILAGGSSQSSLDLGRM